MKSDGSLLKLDTDSGELSELFASSKSKLTFIETFFIKPMKGKDLENSWNSVMGPGRLGKALQNDYKRELNYWFVVVYRNIQKLASAPTLYCH